MSIILKMIPSDKIESVWAEAGNFIEQALKYCDGETNLEYILADLVRGDRKLLTVCDGEEMIAAVILSMSVFPRKKVCHISLVGGIRMNEWCDQGLPTIEQLAREAGADTVRIQGRKGWLRRLKTNGYKEIATVIGKDL
jgi:hypothetical protein